MPTLEQLNLMLETEFEFPWTRRTDDPMYSTKPDNLSKMENEKVEKPDEQKQIESFLYQLGQDPDIAEELQSILRQFKPNPKKELFTIQMVVMENCMQCNIIPVDGYEAKYTEVIGALENYLFRLRLGCGSNAKLAIYDYYAGVLSSGEFQKLDRIFTKQDYSPGPHEDTSGTEGSTASPETNQ